MEPKIVAVSGAVTRERVARGSKSEREAVTLRGPDGEAYLLRRRGGPVAGDAELDALVGSSLTVRGVQFGDTIIMHDWDEAGEPGRP